MWRIHDLNYINCFLPGLQTHCNFNSVQDTLHRRNPIPQLNCYLLQLSSILPAHPAHFTQNHRLYRDLVVTSHHLHNKLPPWASINALLLGGGLLLFQFFTNGSNPWFHQPICNPLAQYDGDTLWEILFYWDQSDQILWCTLNTFSQIPLSSQTIIVSYVSFDLALYLETKIITVSVFWIDSILEKYFALLK
jgi:hypothetical protein